MVIIPFCKSVYVIIQISYYTLLLYDTIINGIRGKNMSQKEKNAIIFPYFYDKLCIITKTSTRKKDVFIKNQSSKAIRLFEIRK
ncbi:MAG TPA: hypothetical protein DIV56_05430 [Lachnospiraceae bacterium]|jgi:hypothetical protein|nr:hypothetical protein [Lachnospiraceae bacterium]